MGLKAGDPRTSAIARQGGYARWESVSDDERQAALDALHATPLAKARRDAIAQAERLGLILSPEQADAAAARLYHETRVAALVTARAARKAVAK